MGVAGLRDAFNAVCAPRFVASLAFLSMERADGTEWSRLRFSGIAADGAAFEVVSDRLPAGFDVVLAAKQTAQKMIDDAAKAAPPTEPPP